MPSEKSIKAGLALIEADHTKILGLTVGNHESVQPGQYIPKADARVPSGPRLFFHDASPSKTYLVVSLDIDAPFPSWRALGPILHWIQPNVKVAADESVLDTTAPFIANWIPPSPPPGSAPHRYTFFLYEQPNGFRPEELTPPDGKNLSNWHRMRFDLDEWARKHRLGPILAFNYFTSN